MGSPEVHIEWVYTPLQLEAVRWYSYRSAFDAKELAKATEIPHRGSLLRFCAADSAALEAVYQSRRDELERCWWEEEAALHSKPGDGGSPGAGGTAAGAAAKGAPPLPVDPGPDTTNWAHFMGGCAGDEPGVPVRSGAFEVDLPRRQLRPCYWPASRHRVLRGSWFVEKGGEWVPLKESLAEQLEEGYRQAVWLPARGRLAAQPGGGYAARLELTTHVERGLYALFASESEAWLCQETGWAWLRRIGASSTAGQQRLRLRRGYEPPTSKGLLEKEADLRQEELDDGSAGAPVSRLVLVVHGIGQKLASANIAQDASSFRSVLRQVAQDQAQAGLLDEAGGGRTEVLPVQWRKHLHIEADQLSRQLMPPGIPSLRQTLHSTVVEILLYMSPQHRPGIVTSLVTSLNSTYQRFMDRNPGFQGTVSILAHSLGTVLCYDILCHQPQQAQQAQQAGGSPPRPMQASLPASPSSEQRARQGQQPGFYQQDERQQHAEHHQQRQEALGSDASGQSPPGSARNSTGADQAPEPREQGPDGMAIDLVADSPTAALHQELSRLRAENQRLRLQLDLAGAPAGSSGDWQRGQEAAWAAQVAMSAGGSPGQPAPVFASPQRRLGTQLAGAEGLQADARFPPRLLFSVDQLIMLGSPLGCFLALRGVDRGRGAALGSAACAPLMRLAPGQPVTPDGLPAVRRLHNVYHPYDPVAHRLEPLALPPSEVQRAAFVPLFKGGKRIHLAVQEFSEDVGSAASRFGTTLLSSLAFAKLSKSSASLRQESSGEAGASAGSAAAAAAAAEVAAEAAEAAEEEEAARHLTGASSSPALRGVRGGGGFQDGDQAALEFGALDAAGFGGGSGDTSRGPSGDGGILAQSPSKHLLQPQVAGALAPAAGQRSSSGGSSGARGISRVADGLALPGSKTAAGRVDFVMQESSLENQYLSALSAHFVYWTNADVALFVLRAVHNLDVLTGASKQQQQAAPAEQAAQEAVSAQAEQGGQRVEPTSPRQHLIALP